ncbi:uncharacterized protein LACBIDRAFT_335456 [Laccaria bicolor S238N-H82]|uniref:Predicted protein n=1 Tax=Laccaria bicolor (strain S238N-H82 / ATCC MYA-4686) TaxID=486041 RepID=B0E2D4_LACBS|nr:uncharacterized protein LACBIDRAFT_335456 [Laccaria bicolor S238N-H82]EDQ98990.1 predicted protein [Laccaria bicolor S238N-H82]|eukprot:XP_001890351.1 predicted protein [Laccaria bicolor S238N-H82]
MLQVVMDENICPFVTNMTPVLVIHYFCPHIPSSSRHQWVPSLMASSSCHPNTGGWAMAPRGLGSKTGSDLNGEGMFMSFAMSNFAPFSFKWFCTQPFCGVLEVGVESGKGEREGEVEYTAEGGFQDGLPNVFPGVRITRLGRYDASLFDAYAGIAVLDVLHGHKPRLVSPLSYVQTRRMCTFSLLNRLQRRPFNGKIAKIGFYTVEHVSPVSSPPHFNTDRPQSLQDPSEDILSLGLCLMAHTVFYSSDGSPRLLRLVSHACQDKELRKSYF